MKNLFLSIMVLCASFQLSAQTAIGVNVPIFNYTGCDLFVTIFPTSPGGGCTEASAITIWVSANGTATIPGTPGMVYEVATIRDNPWSPSYQIRIQSPGPTTGWPGAPISYCYSPNTYPQCDAAMDCMSLLAHACWDGTSVTPSIIIVN